MTSLATPDGAAAPAPRSWLRIGKRGDVPRNPVRGCGRCTSMTRDYLQTASARRLCTRNPLFQPPGDFSRSVRRDGLVNYLFGERGIPSLVKEHLQVGACYQEVAVEPPAIALRVAAAK